MLLGSTFVDSGADADPCREVKTLEVTNHITDPVKQINTQSSPVLLLSDQNNTNGLTDTHGRHEANSSCKLTTQSYGSKSRMCSSCVDVL